MQSLDNNTQAFLALVRGGLWEKDVRLSKFEPIDYSRVISLAEEQSVVGLVAAGLEHVSDVKVPKEDVLQFVGQTLQLEQRNTAMNNFIRDLVDKMRTAGIYTLLVKGQGIAQCYERPLWRACGDIDLLFNESNYEKAKDFFIPLALTIEKEALGNKHLGLTVGPWEVELHGTLHGDIKKRIDNVIDQIQIECFSNGTVRIWQNDKVNVMLPAPDNDIIIVFSHILQHFFNGGIGLRQICDWCRLLWTFRESIDRELLKDRLKRMGIMSEWKAFTALAVNDLGIPADDIPYYSSSVFWKIKSDRILRVLLSSGNFGHNFDHSYYSNYPYYVRKLISFWEHTKEAFRHVVIFPFDSIKIWWIVFLNGVIAAFKGK